MTMNYGCFGDQKRVGGIICCSASAECLCPRGASARVLDHVPLWYTISPRSDQLSTTGHKYYFCYAERDVDDATNT